MTTRKQFTLFSSLLLMASANARNGDQQHPETALLRPRVLQTGFSIENGSDSSLLLKPADSAALTKQVSLKAPQVPMNQAAAAFVQMYIKKNNEGLQKVAERSEAVFKIMEPILARYDLPAELKYLAVVESDLKRTAVSRVGAAGPWQLMPTTARELGLKVSKKYDERKQYAKSTTAAALYLRDLYRTYEDWLLVIAAYNAGPGVVNKAIRRSGSRNFWKLQAFLPAETRGHVKRFIGTHYFFEETGGETTLTKAETIAHAKVLARFNALQECETAPKATASFTSESTSTAPDMLEATVIQTVLLTKEK